MVEDMQLNFIQGSGGRDLAPCQEHSDKDIIPGFIGNREFWGYSLKNLSIKVKFQTQLNMDGSYLARWSPLGDRQENYLNIQK